VVLKLGPLLSDLVVRDRARERAFAVQLFRMEDPPAVEALESLLRSGDPSIVHDTLEAQLGELVETRNPDRKLAPEEVRAQVRACAGDDLSSYGTWVYYSWSRRLVHVLPAREYEELRTSRNRNKITRDEQTRLARLRVGVAGLSVGQSTAVTLALEGVGGHFRLADFDTLSLSNMNRLRAGVHEIGVNKAVLVAREIYEINPYARVEVFDRGIVDDTLDAFFSAEGALDLLFEECDDLKMKVRLRHEARKRRIPVLMETSDRGLFDVERFDREPERPLFHGLVGALDPDKLAGMTTYEKVPIVLDIIGARTMSRRMAASLVDIDATLKTWPQLASAVALGGAINTDAARRIALGTFNGSGRFFVDLEGLVSDAASPVEAPPVAVRAEKALPSRVVEPVRGRGPSALEGPVSREQLDHLVGMASLAPSGGNCQPWRFTYERGALSCLHDEDRSRSFLDFEHRATYAAFGALAENLSLASRRLGVGVAIEPFPDADDAKLVCRATFGVAASPATAQDGLLAAEIERRVTNRRLGKRVALDPDEARALEEMAGGAGGELHLLTRDADLSTIGEILGLGERLRLMSAVMHREMMSELRWSREEALSRGDGLDLATLELTPTDEAGMRLIADWSVMSAVCDVEGGHGLAQPSRKAIASASAVALLTVPRLSDDGNAGRRARSYFDGGRALQRVWLRATSLGLAVQPMTALVYLFARLDDGEGLGLDEREKRELSALRGRFRALFGSSDVWPHHEVMLFRLAKAGAPSARSLRRPISDLLTVEHRADGRTG
jgi:nitroreductase